MILNGCHRGIARLTQIGVIFYAVLVKLARFTGPTARQMFDTRAKKAMGAWPAGMRTGFVVT